MIRLGDLAEGCGGLLEGDPDILIRRAATLEDADADCIVFAADERFAVKAVASDAGALLLPANLEPRGKPCVRCSNVRLSWAKVLEMLYPEVGPVPGIHPGSVIDPSAVLAENVEVGPHCTVGPQARIDEDCILGPGVVVEASAIIGRGSVLHAHVVIGTRCIIGQRNILYPGVVVGADGFGFAREGSRYHRIPHVGIVRTGDDVEIGANTTVDRAALGETVIGDGVKIDNLCQIAHNVIVGRDTVMAALTGIGGSATIGPSVMMGGQSGVADHVSVGGGTIVYSGSGVTRDTAPGAVLAGFPAMPHRDFLRGMVCLSKLPALLRKLEPKAQPVVTKEGEHGAPESDGVEEDS